METALARAGRFLRQTAVAVIVALMFWTVLIMLFEDRFIFFPSGAASGPYDDIRSVRTATEHMFTASDGTRLHGVYATADGALATVIFSHGNAGNLSYRFDWMRRTLPLPVNIFLYDYRGYGKSQGSPSEDGVYADAEAAYDYVVNELRVPADSIVAWGRSLGGAVAVDLATKRPVRALILESTFSSGAAMARDAYPFLPFLGDVIRSEFASDRKIKTLAVPSLHIHGSEDNIISPGLGEELFNAAPPPKERYIIPGAGHNDGYVVGGDAYLQRVRSFLGQVMMHDRR